MCVCVCMDVFACITIKRWTSPSIYTTHKWDPKNVPAGFPAQPAVYSIHIVKLHADSDMVVLGPSTSMSRRALAIVVFRDIALLRSLWSSGGLIAQMIDPPFLELLNSYLVTDFRIH